MFLVTGLPRTRSAWFAALLGAAHAPKVEDYARLKNVCDPCAACLHPNYAITVWYSSPIVVIERSPEVCGKALSDWVSHPVWGAGWNRIVQNYELFKYHARGRNTQFVNFEALDDYHVVNSVHHHLTGETLSRERFDLFNGLKIEQHLGKARSAVHIAA